MACGDRILSSLGHEGKCTIKVMEYYREERARANRLEKALREQGEMMRIFRDERIIDLRNSIGFWNEKPKAK
jgi:hypothetical protein